MAGLFENLRLEIETRQSVKGITLADLLDLSPRLRRLINTIIRRGEMSLIEIASELYKHR